MTRVLIVLTAAAIMAAAPQNGEARGGRIVAGPIIGGIAANNGYYAYGPYYDLNRAPLYVRAPGCYAQRQRIWTDYGWRWRTATICY
jgi:hypothetical protein